MLIEKIRKRDWQIVNFDKFKILNAIKKAMESAWETNDEESDQICSEIIFEIFKIYWKSVPDVEQIQDIVEKILIRKWKELVAKNYIIYRQKRSEIRESRTVQIDVAQSMNEYLEKQDWRVNANANSWYSLWWLILNVSWKVTANYWLSHVYPSFIWNAHRDWDVHIHDLDMFSWYCAGWSLRQLLEEWFNWLTNRIESAPPRNLQAAVNQMINFLWTLQNERAWAQAFSSFDTYLAPYVHKYKKEKIDELKNLWVKFENEHAKKDFIFKKTYAYVLQQMQNFIFWLNVPSRWWTQTPFTNITLDWRCPEDLKEKALFLWWYEKWEYEKKYWELDEEMMIINRALIEVYTKWDANWKVFTFPIPTYNITPDFPWEDENTDLLFEMTAKYWIPYFQNFIWSQYKTIVDIDWNRKKVINENAYKPSTVRSMCCRLQLDLNQLTKRWNWLFWSAEMTWSIWVVTLNLARIWYKFKWDFDWYKKRLKYLMDLAKMSLEIKRKELQKWLDSWLFPYTKRYLHSFRNHFSTIWINWMNESILNFTQWKENISSEFWMNFANKLLDFMREILTSYQEETWNLYNLEATPAEWTTYRFWKEDKKRFEWIIQAWTQSAPYYTNSTQLSAEFTDDMFEALDLQNDLQCKYTGWTVFHIYLWERVNDAESCKNLVKKVISNYQIPYISITPTFSICPIHWYIKWEHDFCPICDEQNWYEWEKFNIEYRQNFTSDLKKIDKIKSFKIENKIKS